MTWDQLTIGSWVSTSEGCPVRTVIGEDSESVTFVFGTSGNEFELTIDRSTLAEMLQLGSQALSALVPASR
ncbi:hypothetical protein [Nocardia abscessus]|uniref:hypothetical protein n=1 Tax=Nocardia abscessus TaxID=120957 RepID=UPI0012F97B67|nr:hypothetical protein [Nocardia abscessus]MCC3329689.1 hypothetical protein [Nocardia abscessus]